MLLLRFEFKSHFLFDSAHVKVFFQIGDISRQVQSDLSIVSAITIAIGTKEKTVILQNEREQASAFHSKPRGFGMYVDG